MVEAASVLRRITVPALAAVLERDEPAAEHTWRGSRSGGLPFATVRPDGVELQPVVQDVARHQARARDPGRAANCAAAPPTSLSQPCSTLPGWAATADLLHLVQNPVVRSAFLPAATCDARWETAHGRRPARRAGDHRAAPGRGRACVDAALVAPPSRGPLGVAGTRTWGR